LPRISDAIMWMMEEVKRSEESESKEQLPARRAAEVKRVHGTTTHPPKRPNQNIDCS
jgi:hypothetical protein